MPGAGGPVTTKRLGKRSLLRLQRFELFAPEAASDNKIVASTDPSGWTVGTALTLQTNVDGKLLRAARRPKVIATDASGGAGGLSVTVEIRGYRFGVLQTEQVTVTCTDGNATTVVATKFYDELLAPIPRVITGAASGDAVTVGVDGAGFGLPHRIKATTSVKSIINVATNTEAAPTAISSTTVDVDSSAVKGLTLATTDRWTIQYVADGEDGWAAQGAMA